MILFLHKIRHWRDDAVCGGEASEPVKQWEKFSLVWKSIWTREDEVEDFL